MCCSHRPDTCLVCGLRNTVWLLQIFSLPISVSSLLSVLSVWPEVSLELAFASSSLRQLIAKRQSVLLRAPEPTHQEKASVPPRSHAFTAWQHNGAAHIRSKDKICQRTLQLPPDNWWMFRVHSLRCSPISVKRLLVDFFWHLVPGKHWSQVSPYLTLRGSRFACAACQPALS